MSRLVRCPKCSKLLIENSTVPIYQCGGCGTVLRAKNYNASGDNAITEPLQISSNPDNQSETGISDNGPTSAINYKDLGDDAITETPQISTNQESCTEIGISDIGSTSASEMILPSSSSPSPKVKSEEERQMGRDDSPARSCMDGKQNSKNGEHFETDSEIVESSSILNSSKPTEEPLIESENHVTDQAKRVSIDEQMDKLLNSNNQISGHSKMNNEVGQSPRSFSNSTASTENLAVTLQNDGLDVLKSPAAIFNSHYYEGIISCDDGQTIQSPNSQQHFPKGKEQEDPIGHNKIAANNESDRQLGTRLSTSSNETIADVIRDEISLHYENGKEENVKSFGSIASHSVLNWKPEKGGGSSSNNHLEFLRKLDDLRVQVTELRVKRLAPGGIHEIHQNFDLQSNPSLNHHPRRPSYEQCTCLQCERGQPKLANLHKKGPYRTNSSYISYHPSKEHDSGKSYLNSRPKQCCQPVSGAAPFVICDNCVKLLQLPTDFFITRKKLHKLKCEFCNEVLMFPFPDRVSSTPETPSRSVHSSTKVDKDKNGSNYHANNSP